MNASESMLALFETTIQLDALLNLQKRTSACLQLVAATPEADYAAEKCGVTYRTIEEFYSDPDLMELGVRNFAWVGDFCDTLDRYLHQALAGIPGCNLISAHHYFYEFKRLFDALLHRALTVTAVLENTRPQTVICFDVPPYYPDLGAFLRSNRLISQLVPLIAQRLGARVIVLPLEKAKSMLSRRQRLRSLVLRLLGSSKLVGVWRLVRRWRWRAQSLSLDTNRPTLVADPGSGFDAGLIAANWQRSGTGNVVTLSQVIQVLKAEHAVELGRIRDLARRATARAWQNISQSPEIRAFFQIAQLDLYPLVKPCLEHFVCFSIPDQVVLAEALKRGMGKEFQAVVLMRSGDGVVCAAARELGHPTVVFQHGGSYGYLDWPMAEYQDLSRPSYFFCWGPRVASFFAQPSSFAHRSPSAPRSVPVAVGSPSLDYLVARHRGTTARNSAQIQQRTVVYVLTNLGGDGRYFSYHMYPDIWLWRLQRQVIETCSQFSDVQLIVKLYPRSGIRRDLIHNPIVDWLKDAQLPMCRVVQNIPFKDLLPIGSLFIIDLPATTLLEALTTTKPIITFADTRWLRLDPAAAALLRKRVILSESSKQFLQDIKTILSQPDWTLPEPVNDEFLRAYGTHLNDGRSAERASHLLLDLAIGIRP